MTNNTKDILAWAVNFFTSVKATETSIVSTRPEHEYDVQTALKSLSFLLQDSGVSRIPPGCKLPHQHYRNPAIFVGDPLDATYEIIETTYKNEYYCEYYVRREKHTGFYYAGVEAIKSSVMFSNDIHPDSRISRDMPLFSIDPETNLYKNAIKAMFLYGEELKEARIKYLAHEELTNKFIDELLNSIK